MKVQILHNVQMVELVGQSIPAIFDPARIFSDEGAYRPGDLLAPVLEFELPDCFAKQQGEQFQHQYIAELCWRIGQNDMPMNDTGPIGDIKAEYLAAQIRSLCMGDVVIISNFAYFAATVGWQLCPGDGLNLSKKSAATHQRELTFLIQTFV